VVSARRSSSSLWGRCPAAVGRDISRKVDWTSRAKCMASSVTWSNSGGLFPVGQSERTRLCRPSQDYQIILWKSFKQEWQRSTPAW
jgi:hypothetical protein